MREALIAAALAAAIAASGSAVAAEPTPQRQAELLYLLRQDCGSCHGMTLKGGLGPALLPGTLADLSDEALVDAILNGREETPMPPWAFEIGEDEALWMVRRLKEGLPDDR